jgi:16S rRNA (guanine(966)-N(2))-methyltransferase RsmD
MRVITGTARGRRLREPAGMDIRPTTDKVKEAMFNIIQFDIEGRRVLDLFAGTGQLGIEAMSRGAANAAFVDRDKTAAKLVRENLDKCGLRGSVHQAEALSFLAGCGQYDLIFVDPPYDAGLYGPVMDAILKFDILPEGGIIVCESRREAELPELAELERRDYNYGQVKLTVYTRKAAEE